MKYGNHKTVICGIQFDSKAESQRYLILLDKLKAGEISRLKLQPKFELIPKGNGERALTYTADFQYAENGIPIVEDVKSEATRKDKAYIIKRKLFKHKYPGFEFREIISSGWR